MYKPENVMVVFIDDGGLQMEVYGIRPSRRPISTPLLREPSYLGMDSAAAPQVDLFC